MSNGDYIGSEIFSKAVAAIRKNQREEFDTLISDELINYRTKDDQWNWLHLALLGINPPSVQIVRHLIARGVDINSRDRKGYSPLHLAARCKRAPLVEVLIDNGADVEAQRAPGMTPIRETILAKPFDIESIRVFIKSGADVNTAPPGGKSVIELAALLSHGVDSNLIEAFSV